MESFAISLLATLAAVPIALRAWQAGARFLSLLGLGAWVLATGAAVFAYRPTAPQAEGEVTTRPVAQPSEGYVTSETCKACHPAQYASWRDSYHSTMTQLATPESVLGRWSGRLQYAYWYDLEREGDEFWVRSDDPAFRASGGAPGRRRVVLTTGSHHEQMYWYELGIDRGLGFFPMVYRVPDQRWFPFFGVVLKPSHGVPHGAMRWNVNCVRCHTTDARPGVTIEGDAVVKADTQSSEFGISCEACHGPAAEHVRAHRDPFVRYANYFWGDGDETIVNPARLPSRREADVCGSCHSIHTSKTPEETAGFLEGGYGFRPGDRLEDMRYIARGGERDDSMARELLEANPHAYDDRFWSDGKPSAGGREYNGLLESPCYQRGTMDCGSCHVMHQTEGDSRLRGAWADDQLGAGMDGNEACLQCHDEYRADPVAHTHHASGAPGSLCYDCHMPNTTYGLLKQTRSHEVDSPSVASTQATGRENACNLCHLDRSLGWVADAMERWYGTPRPALSDEQESVADGLLQALRGDAGQRAMLAWHMGWAPARSASRGDWMVPVLAQLLEDPYAAVRYVAGRALVSIPGFEGFDYFHIASPDQLRAKHEAALARWEASSRTTGRPPGEGVLIRGDGTLDRARFRAFLAERDDRRVLRNE